MCRLAYIPGHAKLGYKKMVAFFDHLQCAFGGDGNGYVAVSPTGETISNKGVKLSNQQIVSVVYHLIRKGWSVYYHTRKISVGWAEDKQCHPFKISGKLFNGYLCHNGTWSQGATLASYLQVGSDTAALAKVIGKFGITLAEKEGLFPSSGVFLIYGNSIGEKPSHRAVKKYGDLRYCPRTGIWASEFPKDWDGFHKTYTVGTGYHNLNSIPEVYVSPVVVNRADQYSQKKSIPSYTTTFRKQDEYYKWEREQESIQRLNDPLWYEKDEGTYWSRSEKLHEVDWEAIDEKIDNEHKYGN